MKVSKGELKMRNKQRKSSVLNFIVWGLVGFALIVCLRFISRQVETGHGHITSSYQHAIRELEKVEEEHFRLPPPHKVNPRAVKRRAPHKASKFKIIDEYLDGSSALHDSFFPGETTAINPQNSGNDSMSFYPGRVWLDTNGNAIQAHGGGILYDHKTLKYYWYGENRGGPTYQVHPEGAQRVSQISVTKSGLIIICLFSNFI
jgi:hypothetical protein